MQKRRLNKQKKGMSREMSKYIFLAGLFYLDYSQ